jgi:hypothetical protein
MALASVADQFPVGTKVRAYPVGNWPAGTRAQHGFVGDPLGDHAAEAAVAEDGSLAFNDLELGTDYVAHACVDGEDRYRQFRAKG